MLAPAGTTRIIEDRVGAELIIILSKQPGWSTSDRVLDLGAGPGQLSLLVAPFVAEVVAIEPEQMFRRDLTRMADMSHLKIFLCVRPFLIERGSRE